VKTERIFFAHKSHWSYESYRSYPRRLIFRIYPIFVFGKMKPLQSPDSVGRPAALVPAASSVARGFRRRSVLSEPNDVTEDHDNSDEEAALSRSGQQRRWSVRALPDLGAISEPLLSSDCASLSESRLVMQPSPAAEATDRNEDENARGSNVFDWSDAELIAAVRRDPPDEAALNVLADRHWRPLYARCQMLTLDREKASDLAQQAWCRVLRVRQALKSDGNFPAYLATVATNLWRDAHRAAFRAGPMAENRLISIDGAVSADGGDSVSLADVLPDLKSLDADEQRTLAMDLDEALRRLSPLLRDVLVARFITGESCAEIGRRYGRTEQTVSGWVRQGAREMKAYLEGPAESRSDDL